MQMQQAPPTISVPRIEIAQRGINSTCHCGMAVPHELLWVWAFMGKKSFTNKASTLARDFLQTYHFNKHSKCTNVWEKYCQKMPTVSVVKNTAHSSNLMPFPIGQRHLLMQDSVSKSPCRADGYRCFCANRPPNFPVPDEPPPLYAEVMRSTVHRQQVDVYSNRIWSLQSFLTIQMDFCRK